MDIPSMKEEKWDHAEILKAFAEIINKCGDMNVRDKIIGFITNQIFQLEKIHAENSSRLYEQLLDVYEASVERRYASGIFSRFLTLGMSGQHDADKAALGAFNELKQIIGTIEEANKNRIANAVMVRLPLLQYIAGSKDQGNDFAMTLLKSYLPAIDTDPSSQSNF